MKGKKDEGEQSGCFGWLSNNAKAETLLLQ